MSKYRSLSKVAAWLGCAGLVLSFLSGCNATEPVGEQTAKIEKEVRVGIDRAYAPFAWQDENNEVRGIDVDLWRGVAKHQNIDYKLIVRDFDVVMDFLNKGSIDAVISCMNWSSDRAKLYDFSEPYYYSKSVVIASDFAHIASREDLKGKRVAVKELTLGEIWAKKYAEEYGFEIHSFPTSTEAFMSVSMGSSDFTIADEPNAQFILNTGLYAGLHIVIDNLIEDDKYNSLHLLVKKGQNKEVLDAFNAGVKQMKASGEFDQIIHDYLGPDAR